MGPADSSTIDVYTWTREWAAQRGLLIWAQDEVGSTNSVAKEDLALETKPVLQARATVSSPTLYLTSLQTQGRGRGDHKWTTPPGSSLISSWSFAMARVPQPIFSPLAGLALFEAAREVWPLASFNLKAPNDLFIGTKKTAGLLIETMDRGIERHTVVGLGLNVTDSPRELETATSLNDHLDHPVRRDDWQRFLDGWLKRLSSALHRGQSENLDEDVRARLKHALNLHPFLREPILEVDEKGQLRSASRIIYWHEL